RDVLPVLAAVAGDVDQAIVGAGPDRALLDRRLSDGEDGRVGLGAGVVLGDRPARGNHRLRVGAGEVRADRLPAMAAVLATEDDVAAMVEHVGIVRREDGRRGPLEAPAHLRRGRAERHFRPDVDRPRQPGAGVVLGQQAAVAAGVNDVRVVWLDRDVARLASTDLVVLVAGDRAGVGAARDRHRGVVLLRAVDAIGFPIVDGDVVELG